MLLANRYIEHCKTHNLELKMEQSDKKVDDYTLRDLTFTRNDAGKILAELLGIGFLSDTFLFEEQFRMDMTRHKDEGDEAYEKRLITYKDNSFFPAYDVNNGDKYIFAINPDSPAIYSDYSSYKLVMCTPYFFNAIFMSDTNVSTISFHYDPEEGMDNYIKAMLKTAFEKGAQDIDIQTLPASVKIRFQINGKWSDWLSSISIVDKNSLLRVLGSMAVPPKDYRSGVEMRYKMETEINGAMTSWRVGVVPTVLGENVTIRRLPFVGKVMTLKELGFTPRMIGLFDDLMKKESGVCFITGSTGRGKSTTLYAVIREYLDRGLKVNTVEDPIELIVPPAGQVQILNEQDMDEDKRMTYLKALKAFLRQKPDVIVVGETRTSEEAEAVVEAALTGHFTFTTLHTNSFKRTLNRLKTLNIDKAMVSDVLEGVVSQKLVRKLCPSCKVQGEQYFRMKEGGCLKCGGLGYQGRLVVAEFARLDEEAKAMLENEKIDYDEIIRYLESKELYISMVNDTKEKIALGLVDERETGLC